MAAPRLPPELQSGSIPRPRGDSPPSADLGKGGRGKKNFPAWAETMGTKPRSPRHRLPRWWELELSP